MSSVLTVGGQVVDLDNSRTSIQRLTLSVDQPDALEFGQAGVALPFAWACATPVTLEIDGTLVFKGDIESVHSGNIGDGEIGVGYRCYGLKWLAGKVPVTNPLDGTGTVRFNLPSTDPDFIESLTGMSVGAILKYLFDGHATALATVGVTGYNAADLTPLSIVPPAMNGVLIQGSSFIDQCEYFLQNWYAQFVLYIPADGIIRVVDSTAFTAATYTLDSDPVTLDDISRDTTQCYTRVVIRGFALVEAAYLSLADGTLKEAFTASDKLAWTWSSFASPGGAISDGTIQLVTSTQITVQSADPAQTWDVNYWNSIEAVCQVVNPAVTGIAFTENRQITANTALAAGGTATLTFDTPLNNSGYTVYHIWGQPPKVSDTWRLYDIVPTYVAQHLVKQSPRSYPWRPTDAEVVQVNSAAAVICWSSSGQKPFIEFPALFELLPATGQVRFTQPVVRTFGTLSKLQKGGSNVDGIPDDIKVLVFYSRGTLEAVYPPDDGDGNPVYAGTGNTDDGVTLTLYRDYPQWMWGNDLSSYQQLAQQIWNTVSTTLVSGTLTYYGKLEAALTLGTAVNIARVGGTTGLESINAAVRTVSLEWPQTGPTPWITRLSFSTVRRPFSGDALYAHPMFAGGPAFAGSIDMSGAGIAATLAGSLGYMGAGAAEGAAGMLGNSDEVRKALGLETSKPAGPPERDASESGGDMGGEMGMADFGGSFGEDVRPQRRGKKRKRPTLRPKKPPATAEGGADFVGPPRPQAGPPAELSRENQRRARAQRSGAGLRSRYDPEDRKPAEIAGPPKPADYVAPAPGQAGPPKSASRKSQREQRARKSRAGIRARHDDDEAT